MVRVQQRLGVSERRACEVLGQARSTQRRSRKRGADEAALRADVVKVAGRFGRYGYRMVTGMLRAEGWVVNHKRVERIWREEGLKVPKKQPKRGRLWLTDGSCIRLRPLYRHHVWAYDFVADRTHDGRPLKMLTVLDEYSRECLAVAPIDLLLDQGQQLTWRYGPDSGSLEPRLVPGDEIVRLRLLRARCLNRILEVRPVQPQCMPQTVLVYFYDSEKLKQVHQHPSRLCLPQVLRQEIVKGGHHMGREEAM